MRPDRVPCGGGEILWRNGHWTTSVQASASSRLLARWRMLQARDRAPQRSLRSRFLLRLLLVRCSARRPSRRRRRRRRRHRRPPHGCSSTTITAGAAAAPATGGAPGARPPRRRAVARSAREPSRRPTSGGGGSVSPRRGGARRRQSGQRGGEGRRARVGRLGRGEGGVWGVSRRRDGGGGPAMSLRSCRRVRCCREPVTKASAHDLSRDPRLMASGSASTSTHGGRRESRTAFAPRRPPSDDAA